MPENIFTRLIVWFFAFIINGMVVNVAHGGLAAREPLGHDIPLTGYPRLDPIIWTLIPCVGLAAIGWLTTTIWQKIRGYSEDYGFNGLGKAAFGEVLLAGGILCLALLGTGIGVAVYLVFWLLQK